MISSFAHHQPFFPSPCSLKMSLSASILSVVLQNMKEWMKLLCGRTTHMKEIVKFHFLSFTRQPSHSIILFHMSKEKAKRAELIVSSSSATLYSLLLRHSRLTSQFHPLAFFPIEETSAVLSVDSGWHFTSPFCSVKHTKCWAFKAQRRATFVDWRRWKDKLVCDKFKMIFFPAKDILPFHIAKVVMLSRAYERQIFLWTLTIACRTTSLNWWREKHGGKLSGRTLDGSRRKVRGRKEFECE